MAEMSDPELAAFNAALIEITNKFGGLELAAESLKLKLTDTTRTTKETNESYKRLMRERQQEEQRILTEQRKGRLTARETQLQLQSLNDKVREVIPPEYKIRFENAMKVTDGFAQKQMNANSLLVKYNTGLEVGRQVLTSFGNAATKIIGSYASGQTEIEMAGSTFSAGVGALLGSTSALGKSLSAVGAGMMGLSPLLIETGPLAVGVAGIGLGLNLLGNALDAGSTKLNELAQKAIPILTQEVNKLYTSFNAISSAGAIFAGGIKEMNDAAYATRLTLPQFAQVIQENSGNLAMLGISTAEAAKRMGQVGLVMRSQGIDKSLMALGFSAKEQAGLITDTMALMRQSGGSLNVSNEEVARQTQKYAENLRIISAITGEDAKKKEAQVRDQANELAFQQKLAGMDATQRQNTIAAMENMSDAQRKAFMETVVFGQAITPASAYAVANIQGFGDSVNRAVQEFQAGTLDAESMRKNNATYGDTIKQSLIGAVDLARAGMVEGISGFVKDLKGLYQTELQFRNVFTKEAVDNAEAAVELEKTSTEKTTKALLNAAYAGQDMALTIQQAVLDSNVLEIFAGTVADATDAITKVIREFTGASPYATSVYGGLSNREVQDENDRLASRLRSMQETRYSMNAQGGYINTGTRVFRSTGVQYDANTGTYTNPNQTTPVPNANTQERGFFQKLFGYDDGGIASGPKSGYLATLHGTEAVLPENLTTMLLETAKTNQTLKDQLPTANVRPDRTEDLLGMLNNKFDDMIELLDDISSHTERTSVRVA